MAGPFTPHRSATQEFSPLSVFGELEPIFPSWGGHGGVGTQVATARVGRTTRGGDFHVAVRGDSDQAVFCIGTLRGGGTSGGLAKTMLRGTIRAIAPCARSPMTLVRALDRVLRDLNADLEGDRVTCSLFCAVLDPYEESLAVICLGSMAPVVHDEQGSITLLASSGPALGASENLTASVCTLPAARVRRLVVGTQSVTAMTGTPGGGTVFGAERLRDWVRDTSALPAVQQAEVLAEAVGRFLGANTEPPHEMDVVIIDLGSEGKPEWSPGPREQLFGRFQQCETFAPDSSVFLG